MHFSSQYIFASIPKGTKPKSKTLSSFKSKQHRTPTTNSTAAIKTNRNPKSPQVSVSLQKIIPVLVNAANKNVAWIQDFDEEQITISKDLHEVIQLACEMQQGN